MNKPLPLQHHHLALSKGDSLARGDLNIPNDDDVAAYDAELRLDI